MCVPHVHVFKCTASRLKKGGLAIEGLGDCVCVYPMYMCLSAQPAG